MEAWQKLVRECENDAVKEAQEKGVKLVGYICLATPRELIDAAGLFAYRIKALGNFRTELADAYLSRFNCGFCRSCLQLALDGTYDFLDGIIETNGCDHLRGMFENWQYAHPSNFFHYLKVPHLVNEDSLGWFNEELVLMRDALQENYGCAIDESSLEAAIALQKEIADKFREIYESRWNDEIKVKGSEILSLMVAEGSLPPHQFRNLLNEFDQELASREPLDYRARLFAGGSATDEVELIAELESLGGLVVADSFCFGGRVFREWEESGSPLERLASTYLKNLLCPRMFNDYPRRREFILKMIESSRADGAIFFHNKFCDVHGIENVKLRLDLEKEGIPVLTLEKEYGATADIGRLKTRVQAFLERLRK
jgi:benzoyl-CoA reductase/2-hydroxyglutaryl-CoA dehydratase subunit BcrC/BadD/HgdB